MTDKNSEIIAKFLNLMAFAEQRFPVSEMELERQDKITQDILHDLELRSFTRDERSKLAKQLQENRRERRYWKDIMEEYGPLVEFASIPENKKCLRALQQLLGALRKVEHYHEDRTYKPKVKQEQQDGQ